MTENNLNDFCSGTISQQHASFRKLIAMRKHHAAISDDRFKSGLERLLRVASDPLSPEIDRLLAVATLGRIASTIRGIRKNIHKRLPDALKSSLPSPDILDDVDDRAYVGQVCAIALPDWITDYAASAVIIEETGEQARQSFLVALLRSTPDLEVALGILSNHLQGWVPATEAPGNSVSKRLRRILSSLRAAMVASMPEPGVEPGAVLSKMIKSSYLGVEDPIKKDVLFDTAEEVAGVVHEMVRLRFSLATSASTYSALKSIKGFLDNDSWGKFAKKSQTMAMVVLDISEALLILARQGITDSALAEQLVTALGNREITRLHLKELAQKPGLSNEIKNWLAVGRLDVSQKVFSEGGESQKLSDDTLLADILVDSLRFRSADSVGRQQILPEVEILNPSLGTGINRLLNYGLGLCDAIHSMAKRRGLKVRGNVGDEVDYAPLDHDLVGTAPRGRRVRIIRPVVEKVSEDGIPFVLRKGLVESI